MKPVTLSRLAREDIADILRFIAAESQPAAARVLDHLELAIKRLGLAPGMGRPRPDLGRGVRMLVVGPYLVMYREVRGEVQVRRVIHGARDLPELFGDLV